MRTTTPPIVTGSIAAYKSIELLRLLQAEGADVVALLLDHGADPNLLTHWGGRALHHALTATDANRFVLRFARHLTGRPRIAVMDWCYHGTVDETLGVLEHGRAGDRVVAPDREPLRTRPVRTGERIRPGPVGHRYHHR